MNLAWLLVQGVVPAQDADEALVRRRAARLSPLPSVPADPTNRFADDGRAAELGQRLFFDPRLSSNGEVSCATCHAPEQNFTDGRPVAEGLGRGTRKAPTLVNSAYMRWLFWDGRADSLWAQAIEPLENPLEMGGNRLAIAHLVQGDATLRGAYTELFGPLPPLQESGRFPAHARPVPDEPDHPHQQAWSGMMETDRQAVDAVLVNLAKSIAAYERLLVRGDAPFDRYVASLEEADGAEHGFSDAARRGLGLFVGRADCISCHAGPNFSDSEFHATGAPPGTHGDAEDPGRYAGAERLALSPWTAAGEHSDETAGRAARRVSRLRRGSETWGEFRTPSLRNLKGRAPYMHAGQFPDLESVVRFYSTLDGAVGRSHHQERILEPLQLTETEIDDLPAFLESLEGRPLPPPLLVPPPQGRTPTKSGEHQ